MFWLELLEALWALFDLLLFLYFSVLRFFKMNEKALRNAFSARGTAAEFTAS